MTEPQSSKLSPHGSTESGKSPLLSAGSGRSRTYSQSYQATKDSGVLRYGSGSREGTGYGALSDRDTNIRKHHTTSQGEGRYSRRGLSGPVWRAIGIHTEAEKGRVGRGKGWKRRRIPILLGMLLLGTSILWTLTRSYRQDLDFSPAPLPSKTSTTPGKKGYIHLITLPFDLRHPPPTPSPPPGHNKPKQHGTRRLILVGDVHGALDELNALLEKVGFNPSSGADHLVLTGDMVSKGPNSGGVLDLLMKFSNAGVASCVRGNHDDRVVRAYGRLHRVSSEEEEKWASGKSKEASGNEGEGGQEEADLKEVIDGNYIEDWRDGDLVDISGKKKKGSKRGQRKRASDDAVAKTLTPVQATFLASCPLILRVHGAGHQGGELLVVHAGIVPGVPLLKQNPELLMNMRTILPPRGTHGKGKTEYEVGRGSSTTKGRHWAEVWNEWEEKRLKGSLGEQGLEMPEVLKGLDQLEKDSIPEEILADKEMGERGQVTPMPMSHGSTKKGVTVVYGHYAAKGLDVRRWTKGLDSNCVRGGRLSALVVTKGEVGVEMEVMSVKCKAYAS